MTQSRSIILNFIATYGMDLFPLICGMFTVKWALAAMGKVDYVLFVAILLLVVARVATVQMLLNKRQYIQGKSIANFRRLRGL